MGRIVVCMTKAHTAKPMQLWSIRLRKNDIELLRQAASREEISQSEFLRLALRERGVRVILGSPLHSGNAGFTEPR